MSVDANFQALKHYNFKKIITQLVNNIYNSIAISQTQSQRQYY